MLRVIVFGVNVLLVWCCHAEQALIMDYWCHVTWIGIVWDIRKNMPYETYNEFLLRYQ